MGYVRAQCDPSSTLYCSPDAVASPIPALPFLGRRRDSFTGVRARSFPQDRADGYAPEGRPRRRQAPIGRYGDVPVPRTKFPAREAACTPPYRLKAPRQAHRHAPNPVRRPTGRPRRFRARFGTGKAGSGFDEGAGRRHQCARAGCDGYARKAVPSTLPSGPRGPAPPASPNPPLRPSP